MLASRVVFSTVSPCVPGEAQDLHLEQVDDALEVVLSPDGELDDQRMGLQTLFEACRP